MADREARQDLTSEQLEKAKDAIEYLSSLQNTSRNTSTRDQTLDGDSRSQGKPACSVSGALSVGPTMTTE